MGDVFSQQANDSNTDEQQEAQVEDDLAGKGGVVYVILVFGMLSYALQRPTCPRS